MNPNDPKHARTPEERLQGSLQGPSPAVPPVITPVPPPPIPATARGAEAEVPATPLHGFFATAEALLREPGRVVHQLGATGPNSLRLNLVLLGLSGAAIYGIVVGTFSGQDQLWAAPLKTALGLLLSALICLPSLYIFSTLNGARARLSQVSGILAGLVALMTILLLGFAPVAWVFSQSTKSISTMGALHFAFLAIATGFGLRFLRRGFEHFRIEGVGGIRIWTIIYILVMLQMTTALRPFVGTSDQILTSEKKFFLSHWSECLDGR